MEVQYLVTLLLLYLLIFGQIRRYNATICQYCGKDFKSLGKHVWRCKSRVGNLSHNGQVSQGRAASGSSSESSNTSGMLQSVNLSSRETDCENYKCYCGRSFKTYRSLNLHRRSCFIQNNNELAVLFAMGDSHERGDVGTGVGEAVSQGLQQEKYPLLSGVKLPRSESDWNRANDYFRIQIDTSRDLGDLNAEISYMNKVVWSYFKDTCGLVKAVSKFNHYNSMSKSKLKKCLRELKFRNGNLEEIKYISRLLRKRMCLNRFTQRDCEQELNANFWKFCSNELDKSDEAEPNFNEASCFDYFKSVFSERAKHRLFNIPSWLKPFVDPEIDFNLECPSYSEVTKIIRKMKSRGSPCPLDQISIIPFKRCPILRTQLWRLLCKCWQEKQIPSIWKRAVTILIHKKGPLDNPSNFRPITLEPVMLKVLTSLLRNRIFEFVRENRYIETKIQKGFWPGISGTIEHTELLTYLLNHARNKQRSIIVTLVDLKNAFGEIHHNLIRSILKFHHLPDEVISLVEDLYTDYTTSIATKRYLTDPVPVERGVLQGDCLSPLLFNLCVNTLINTIKDEKISCLGYVNNVSLNPCHWFQFADDTALISAHEEDNQHLTNVVSKWCTWADLSIRVEKCHTFGMKKYTSKVVQYEPVITLLGKRIPPIQSGESFTYLGKQFNFEMNFEEIKSELINEINDYLSKIDLFTMKPFSKIRVVQTYVYSKLRWRFSIYPLTVTWIQQNLDSVVSRYLRKWLHIPISGNVSHLQFPKSKLGVDFCSMADIYQQCQMSVRRVLRGSTNADIQHLYAVTSSKNVNINEIIENAAIETSDRYALKTTTDKELAHRNFVETWSSFISLKEQNTLIIRLMETCHKKIIKLWQKIVTEMPTSITCFARRALILSLGNNSNLKRWNIRESQNCDLCNRSQTQLHVFSFCPTALKQHRYTWRHNSILVTIIHHLKVLTGPDIQLYADCPDSGLNCTSTLFRSLRPDVVLIYRSEVYVIELTVPYETNCLIAKRRKEERYRNLKEELRINCDSFDVITLEVTTLGFVSKNVAKFRRLLKYLKANDNRIIAKCMEVALRATFFIYCRRNKQWNDPALLNFY